MGLTVKKLSEYQKRHLIQKSKSPLKKIKKRHAPRQGILTYSDGSRHVFLSRGMCVPSDMCMDRSTELVLTFFGGLRKRTTLPTPGAIRNPSSKRKSRIHWVRSYTDFSTIASITPGAALILASEYDRTYRLFGSRPAVVNLRKWNDSVKATLQQLGFFDLFGLSFSITPARGAPIIQRMVSRSNANMQDGIASIVDLFDRVGGSKAMRLAMSSAVTDAIENVVGHAYPLDWSERFRRVPFWWFVGSADPIARTITLSIVDQGITIPASLPLKWRRDAIVNIFLDYFGLNYDPDAKGRDGHAIDAAMKVGKTSTGSEHRGLGLDKIRTMITRCPSGRLRIVSRFGDCEYRSDGTFEIRTNNAPFLGTYIELEASFSHEEAEDGRDAAVNCA